MTGFGLFSGTTAFAKPGLGSGLFGGSSSGSWPTIEVESSSFHQRSGLEPLPWAGGVFSSGALRHGSDMAGEVVTVLVGRDNNAFSVHRKLLAEASPRFAKALGRVQFGSMLRVAEADADTFGLFLHWLYEGTLRQDGPVSAKGHAGFQQRHGTIPSSYPGPTQMEPTIHLNAINHGHHINMHPSYDKVSPEELKYMEGPRAEKDKTLSYIHYLSNSKASNGVRIDHRAWNDRFADGASCAQALGSPQKQPDEETFLLTLLKLMVLADKYEIPRAYTTAMGLYCEKEARLARSLPHPLHIRIVYGEGAAWSPLRDFMADYVFTAARRSRSRRDLVQLSSQFRHLNEDLAARDDRAEEVRDPLWRFGGLQEVKVLRP